MSPEFKSPSTFLPCLRLLLCISFAFGMMYLLHSPSSSCFLVYLCSIFHHLKTHSKYFDWKTSLVTTPPDPCLTTLPDLTPGLQGSAFAGTSSTSVYAKTPTNPTISALTTNLDPGFLANVSNLPYRLQGSIHLWLLLHLYGSTLLMLCLCSIHPPDQFILPVPFLQHPSFNHLRDPFSREQWSVSFSLQLLLISWFQTQHRFHALCPVVSQIHVLSLPSCLNKIRSSAGPPIRLVLLHFFPSFDLPAWLLRTAISTALPSLSLSILFSTLRVQGSIKWILPYTSHPIRVEEQATKIAAHFDILKLYREKVGRSTDCLRQQFHHTNELHLCGHTQVDSDVFRADALPKSWIDGRSPKAHVFAPDLSAV